MIYNTYQNKPRVGQSLAPKTQFITSFYNQSLSLLRLTIGLWCWTSLLTVAYAQVAPEPGTNTTGPLSQYKSRPDIYAPFLNVTLLDKNYVTPGYIFIAPYQTTQNAIYIYDNYGNLVYSGHGATGPGPSHNFHVSSINGTDRLCYFTGEQGSGYGRGYVNIIDDAFNGVATVRAQSGLSALDEHEFNVVDDGQNALVTTYTPERADLSMYNITGGQGWIQNGFFQKIAIGSNSLLFEWSASDHIDLSESFVLPNTTEVSGTGFSDIYPWDWFHINSVDQTDNGDYIVSSRHTRTVYRVSGDDGSIIWRLGGKSSDFVFETGLNFSYQHDARIRSENASTTILSLFDNASNGYNQTSRYSSGKILKLDHTTTPPTASLLQQYIAPLNFISASQGNVQQLTASTEANNNAWETSNVFLGWGSNAYISEYVAGNPGRMVQQAHFATTGSMNYRAFKANYTTNPTDSPALYTYSKSTSQQSTTKFYMSWNGATRVTDWRVYGRNSSSASWTTLATVAKMGFETIYSADRYWQYGMVEGLENGNALKNSTTRNGGIKAFVPSTTLASSCDDFGCAVANSYGASTSTASSAATTSSSAASPSRGHTRRGLWEMFTGKQKLDPVSAASVLSAGVGVGALLVC